MTSNKAPRENAMTAAKPELVLPAGLTSPADVARLKRGASDLADYLHQLALQKEKTGKTDESLPRPRSGLLAEFAEVNDLDLSKVGDCRQAATLLTRLADIAPVMHMSFASEPSASFLQKVTAWFRKNIDPHTLITVGLQPNIAAGCYLRTTNRYFDLSLRKHLLDHRGVLVEKLTEMAAK